MFSGLRKGLQEPEYIYFFQNFLPRIKAGNGVKRQTTADAIVMSVADAGGATTLLDISGSWRGRGSR